MNETEHYSTLEVDPTQTPEVWREAPGRHLEAQYLQPVTLPPEYKAEEATNISQPPRKTIWGIPRRKFYTLLSIVALLIIGGAIAGGVGGGLAARSHDTDTSTSTNTTNANATSSTHILISSKLAATTLFSDDYPDGDYTRHVAFQDAQGALIIRTYNSIYGNWTTINMTLYFATTTTTLQTAPGTPLAAASCNSWDCLNSAIYFLNTDNSISTVVDRPNANPVYWEYTTNGSTSAVWAGSQLAAAYMNSNEFDTDGSFTIAYQASDGSIEVASLSGGSFLNPITTTLVFATRFTTANSSLALVSQYNENSTSLSDLTILAELTSGVGSGREQLRYYDQSADIWSDNGKHICPSTSRIVLSCNGSKCPDTKIDRRDIDTVSGTVPLPSASQQFAVMALNNYSDYLYLTLLPGGTMSGQWVTADSAKSSFDIILSGGPTTNFSAIATTLDTFYGISNDQILQYSIQSQSDTLQYGCVLYPEEDSDCT